MSLFASDRAGGVSRAAGAALLLLLLLLLLLGGVLSSVADAQVENVIGGEIDIDYHDGSDFNHRNEISGVGFVQDQFDFNPAGGEAHFLANANSKGVELSANLLTFVRQAGDRDLTWMKAKYDGAAIAYFKDTITVIGPQSGRIQYHFDLEGELFYSWRRDGGAVQMENMVTAAHLSMIQNGAYHNIVQELKDPGGLFGGVRGEPNDDELAIAESHTIAFPFNGDEDNDVLFQLAATTVATVLNIDGGEFAGSMRSNFGSTATLRGVTLFDDNGNIITDASIVSESGFDYPIFVPEPSSALFFSVAAFAIRRIRPGNGRRTPDADKGRRG